MGGRRGLVALVLAYLFLNNRSLLAGLAFDIHPEMLWPLGFFSLHLAFLRRARRTYGALLLVVLSIKEDMGLYLFGYGLYLAVFAGSMLPPSDRTAGRILGLATAIGSLAWSVACFVWIIPAFQPAGGASRFLAERWSHLGDGYGEIVLHLLTHPATVLRALTADAFVEILQELLFLPLLDPFGLLALPPLLLNTLSSFDMQTELAIYYPVPLLPFLFVAAGSAAGRILGRIGHRPYVLYAVALIALHENPIRVDVTLPTAQDRSITAFLRGVPPDARVTAQTTLVPHLPIEIRPSLFARDLDRADWVLVDRERIPWPLEPEPYQREVDRVRGLPGFRTVHDDGRFLALRRRVEGPPGPDSRPPSDPAP